jgi:type IV pilus assembly protein PilE
MRNQTGFTLIEVMIAVVIISILATIAYPAYTDYITRSQLAEARTALADMRVRMEQYFQDNRTYVGAELPATGPCTPPGGLSPRFTYSCVVTDLSLTTYTIQAVGVSGGVNTFRFTVARTAGPPVDANARATTAGPAAWVPAATNCWVMRKGGYCQ